MSESEIYNCCVQVLDPGTVFKPILRSCIFIYVHSIKNINKKYTFRLGGIYHVAHIFSCRFIHGVHVVYRRCRICARQRGTHASARLVAQLFLKFLPRKSTVHEKLVRLCGTQQYITKENTKYTNHRFLWHQHKTLIMWNLKVLKYGFSKVLLIRCL